eukprot:2167803-Pyramimonas_sp.AAC.1
MLLGGRGGGAPLPLLLPPPLSAGYDAIDASMMLSVSRRALRWLWEANSGSEAAPAGVPNLTANWSKEWRDTKAAVIKFHPKTFQIDMAK